MAQSPRGGEGPRHPVPVMPATEAIDVVLGRPTVSSVTLSVLCNASAGALSIRYAPAPVVGAMKSVGSQCEMGQPQEVRLDGLRPDTRHDYEVLAGAGGAPVVRGSFRTRRAAGSSFTYTLTADSHLDGNTDAALYLRSLGNVLSDEPDFHIDLGDTFMTDKHENRENAAQQYRAQRTYLAKIGRAAPLFLVLGNHDGEESRLRRGGAESLAVWANGMRKRYFPNPVPDGFYSGNDRADPAAGMLQDYYAWSWGDAQFIVLDPYWHGSGRRGEAPWELTLGSEQYRWLKRTLESADPKFRFVFVHQLVGGSGRQGRGGVEAVAFGEWGGRNADGGEGFCARRPGWEMPIHDLLVRYGVSVVFHGHDHLYARQERDGIVYQEVPQPAHPGEGMPRFAAEYGYREGVILGGAGHLRISVSPAKATVDFVRSSLSGQRNAQVAHGYEVPARK